MGTVSGEARGESELLESMDCAPEEEEDEEERATMGWD
jgi:hypothetical protein